LVSAPSLDPTHPPNSDDDWLDDGSTPTLESDGGSGAVDDRDVLFNNPGTELDAPSMDPVPDSSP
jgi:hypothetical protein